MNLTIIAPHYPPSALPPSQRVRLMMNHFSSFDVNATVVTVDSAFREETEDPWMLELVGNHHDVRYCRVLNPKITRKLGVGDLGLRMLPFLFFKLLKLCRQTSTEFLLYPVPPWYILVIAPVIKWLTGIPYAIDYIDPWVEGGELPPNATVKRKVSQWIAQRLEGWVTRNAAIVFAVSEGINEQLRVRHPKLDPSKMFAIPYGAEQTDYELVNHPPKMSTNLTSIRYIGAVWDDAYLVIDALFDSLSKISFKFEASFYGTSYAGGDLARPQLEDFILKYELNECIHEYPNRVPYKEAVRLNMESDILLLFGGMQSYYAASKLFGLIVSEKPFVAFLHRDSFPAQFLIQMEYPFVVTYSNQEGDLPSNQVSKLTNCLNRIQSEMATFTPLDIKDPRILNHTAKGMTASFVGPMKKIHNERLQRRD